MTKRVLITGIAGHLGSRLASWIVRTHPGTEIVGVDDMSCGYRESIPEAVYATVIGRVSELPVELFDKPFDATFHFAAYAAECLSPFVRTFNYQNNVCETAALLNRLLIAPRRHGRLVFTSSAAVYGHGSCPFDESTHCQPNDSYGVAKLAAEMDIHVAGRQHGLDWCIVRPHNVYGPGQSIWQRYRNVLGLWMRAILEDKPIVVFGDGTQQRAFSYVDEIVPCLWEAAFRSSARGQTVNLGASDPTTINDLVDIVRRATGAVKHPVERLGARHEVKRVWCTTARSKSLLGFREFVPLEEGIRMMWDWARNAWELYPERREHDGAPSIELRNGLPGPWTFAH